MWGHAKCLLYSRGKHNGIGVCYINASILIYIGEISAYPISVILSFINIVSFL